MKVQTIALAHLSPHPDNPRGKIAPADVAELAASIESNGLLSPLVVTQAAKADGRFTVLAGHRRLMALKALERDAAECVILEAGETDATSVMLADNVHRLDLDPLRAGALVESYLSSHEGATVESFAKKIGKTVRWVAQTRALGSLVPAWRKRRDDPEDPAFGLSMARLVALASLSPEAQERLAKDLDDDWHFERDVFERQIAEETRRLSDALWDLDDRLLVKKAGACSTCPKTSLGTPGLFDGTGDPGDVKKAICRDGGCFIGKLAAHTAAAIKAKAAEHGGRILVFLSAPGDHSDDAGRSREFVEALNKAGVKIDDGSWRFEKSKEGKAAYIVLGKDAGKVIHVRERRSSGGGGRDGSGYESPADKVRNARSADEVRAAKRLKFAFVACAADVKAMDVPGEVVVMGLALAYGLGETYIDVAGHARRRKRFESVTGKVAFVTEAWDHLRGACHLRFDVGNTVQAKEREAELRWLADVLKLKLADHEKAAALEFPDPVARAPKPVAKASKPAPAPKATKAASCCRS